MAAVVLTILLMAVASAATESTTVTDLRAKLAAAEASRARADARADTAAVDAAVKAAVAASEVVAKDKAVSWGTFLTTFIPIVAFMGGLAIWYVKAVVRGQTLSPAQIRLMMRAEMAEANAEQLRQINGTYVRAGDSKYTGSEFERVLVDLKDEVKRLHGAANELYRYAHEAVHEWNRILSNKMALKFLLEHVEDKEAAKEELR